MTAVDYSFARPTVGSLVAAGVTAVGRYVGPPGWGKTIQQAEYDALVGAGIQVFLVFEIGPNDGDGGFTGGAVNARTALQYAPAGYGGPIYMAVDTAVSGASLEAAVQYIRGASSVLGPERTGDYGEGALLTATDAAGYATHHWQSASTSYPGNASTTPVADIQQGGAGPVSGTDLDTIVHPIIAAPSVPAPTSSPRGDTVVLHTVSIPTDGNGDGWVPTIIPWGEFLAISHQGSDPAASADDRYWPGSAHAQDRGGCVLASVTGCLPGQTANVLILATS